MLPLRDTIPSRHAPVMTLALILGTAAVFVFELTLDDGQLKEFFYRFGIVPARTTHPDWAERVGLPLDSTWPFLTSIFLHGGWTHVIGNLWILWIFGDNVEDRMGPLRFLVFYLACGAAAGGVHGVTSPDSSVPTVGASGAIAGVMGAYFLLFPRSRVVTVFPIFFYPVFFTLPAVTFLAYWFLVQLLSGTAVLAGPRNAGGVAWWAHVGGFLAGAVLHRLFLSPHRRRHAGDSWPDLDA